MIILFFCLTDASSTPEAVHLQQRLKSLSSELVTLRKSLDQQPPANVLSMSNNQNTNNNNNNHTLNSNNLNHKTSANNKRNNHEYINPHLEFIDALHKLGPALNAAKLSKSSKTINSENINTLNANNLNGKPLSQPLSHKKTLKICF